MTHPTTPTNQQPYTLQLIVDLSHSIVANTQAYCDLLTEAQRDARFIPGHRVADKLETHIPVLRKLAALIDDAHQSRRNAIRHFSTGVTS